ncbi:dephospho-CoA kinase [Dethiobacter alkaliphilus]|uniref:dephospho-CoA kinase n=1 Tax=Dethiobacter alkaliphilus TaxID=427926 RepID=UPI002226C32E|nr:dephospho-CoA kinase [Dethiobacter alkaliphilus]MCW3490421.1 dephospho-CoA kinase [Dethiobacter alkaliphilus]
MLVVGLTGGIATGKSTVAGMFADLGAYRIDADQLAREVVQPGNPAWEAIVRYFGDDILEKSGQLDRKKLGDIIFADPQMRQVLNGMTHPPVRALLREELARAREQGSCVALVEVPLLYEAGFERDVDRVIVVTTSPSAQRSRLMQRSGLTREEARLRIEAQMPLSEKVARADFVIDNDKTLPETKAQVLKVWQMLLQECG